MAYETLPDGRDRYVIVDGESHPDERTVTPNLTDDQFKIELLMAEDCPIRTSCIRIEMGINSICSHVGTYELAEVGKSNFSQLTCLYGKAKVRAVTELWIEGCPLGKNCASCEDLLSVNIPSTSSLDKSHAYVTCRTSHRIR